MVSHCPHTCRGTFPLHSDGFKDSDHLEEPGKVFRVVGSTRNSVQYLTDGQSGTLEASLSAGKGCNSTACATVSALVVLERGHDNAASLKLTYRVTSGEPNVTSGIHIHTGSNCSNPGGLLSNTNPNAWIGVTYSTDGFGNGEGSIDLDTGFALEENAGRVVTIHDARGAALACGVLGEGRNQVTKIPRRHSASCVCPIFSKRR